MSSSAARNPPVDGYFPEPVPKKPPYCVRVSVDDLTHQRVEKVAKRARDSEDHGCRAEIDLDRHKVFHDTGSPRGRFLAAQRVQAVIHDVRPLRLKFCRHRVLFNVENHDVADRDFGRMKPAVCSFSDGVVDPSGYGFGDVFQYGFRGDLAPILGNRRPSDVPVPDASEPTAVFDSQSGDVAQKGGLDAGLRQPIHNKFKLSRRVLRS